MKFESNKIYYTPVDPEHVQAEIVLAVKYLNSTPIGDDCYCEVIRTNGNTYFAHFSAREIYETRAEAEEEFKLNVRKLIKEYKMLAKNLEYYL